MLSSESPEGIYIKSVRRGHGVKVFGCFFPKHHYRVRADAASALYIRGEKRRGVDNSGEEVGVGPPRQIASIHLENLYFRGP